MSLDHIRALQNESNLVHAEIMASRGDEISINDFIGFALGIPDDLISEFVDDCSATVDGRVGGDRDRYAMFCHSFALGITIGVAAQRIISQATS